MLAFAAGGSGDRVSSNGPPGTACINRNARIETVTTATTSPLVRPRRYRAVTRLPAYAQRLSTKLADVFGDVHGLVERAEPVPAGPVPGRDADLVRGQRLSAQVRLQHRGNRVADGLAQGPLVAQP